MLNRGAKLGTYEVTSHIGSGGMGDVYQAHDTKLDRDVAIKVLPEQFARDSERLARFQREAKLLAALNHPNIAAIYGLEQSGDTHYLVMELVPGQTLRERVAGQRAVPVEEALTIAKQIAEALEAAHGSEKGIIQRDLKPANVKVTPEGRVKVLDFGLAKAFAAEQSTEDMANSPTLSAAPTMQGVIMGTAAYMSPEQARGKTVTKAADIWAFGAVLYELLTGRAAFEGEDVTEILAAVVKSEPDWKRLPEATPPAIRTLLRRCLRKDRRQRLQDAASLRIEIEDALSGAATAEPAARASTSWRNLAWGAAAMFLLSTLALGAVLLLRTPEPVLPLQATLLPPENHDFFFTFAFNFAISPDGTKIAFVTGGNRMLWVRPLDSTTSQPLAGTDGAAVPFWSPDSRSIGFFAERSLKKIDAGGGPVITLAPVGAVNPQGGTWRTDGTIVFTRGTLGEGLYQVSSGGGPVSSVTRYQTGESNHRWPFFLPDGHQLLFQVLLTDSSGGNVNEIRVLDLETKEQNVLLRADSPAQYANGHLFYIQEENLMAQPFALSSGTLSGAPVAIAQQTRAFSASPSGLLAFQGGSTTTQLVWYTREGKELGQVGSPGQYNAVALSPDGTKAAVSVLDIQTRKRDIWAMDLLRGTASRVTTAGMGANFPIWSRDGTRVIYWDGERGGGIYSKRVSGLGGSELVKQEAAVLAPSSISPDGKFLVYTTRSGSANARLWIHELAPEKSDTKDRPLLGTSFREVNGQSSPDGHWLAYESSEGTRPEVYLVPFPSLSSKVQVSTAGGRFPRWRRDGKELYYIAPDGNMMAIALDFPGDTPKLGTPKALFQTRVVTGDYDVTADGQKFLINSPPAEEDSEPITLYSNWAAALKK